MCYKIPEGVGLGQWGAQEKMCYKKPVGVGLGQ